MTQQKKDYFIPITLGLLTAFGPFVTDFYLSTLPEICQYFDTPESMVQLSLTMGMIGLAAGQLLIGPLTDKVGRKNILVFSMLLFAISGGLCIFSPNIYVFNALRLFQGIAGAGGIVISRSMATDMYRGKQLANFMALLQSINGVAPVCAPVIGGGIASLSSWKGVFLALLAVGVMLMVCSMKLKETLVPEKRTQGNIIVVYKSLFHTFKSPIFTFSVLICAAFAFPFFAYISSSPFILQEQYGLSPLAYSLCFGFSALMIGVGAALSMRFKSPIHCLQVGAINFVISALLVAACLMSYSSVWLLMGAYVYMVFSFGMMQSPAFAYALDSQRERAGAASAITGASLFVAGGIASPLVGMGDIRLSSSLVCIGGAIACFLFTLLLQQALKKRTIMFSNL